MKKAIYVLGLAALSLAACQRFEEGEGGMQYKIVEDKGSEKLKEGDFVSFGAEIKTEEDSVVLNTAEAGQPSYMQVQAPMYAGDLMTAFMKMGNGDSAVFKMNIDSLKKLGMQIPENTKGTHMVYAIRVNHVIPKGDLTDSVWQEQVEKYIASEEEKAKNAEGGKIAKYIESNKLKTQKTASGLQYVFETEGKGPVARPGDTVEVNYTGRFLNGKVFDTSIKEIAQKEGHYMEQRPYEPIKLPVGQGNVISGWDEALTTFPEGSKLKMVLPSKLAYGERGSMGIPPYTPLVFEIDILDVIPQKAGAETANP